jgi:Mg2+-importing ATPase
MSADAGAATWTPQEAGAPIEKRREGTSRGLTSAQAEELLREHGPNEPSSKRGSPIAAEIFSLVWNPLVLILLGASVVSASLGEPIEGGLIALIVLLSLALDFFQTYRSRRAADALRAEVAPTATVLRDGAPTEIARRLIVPGDVIRLSAGDLVPADAKLLDARDLHLQEAALTGESMPVEKLAGATDERGMVRLGTSVVSGTAEAEVIATGDKTQFGDIAARLRERAPDTEFDRGLHRFGALILRTVFALVLFIVVAGVAMHRNALETMLFAVALAVGLTPEFLPMITTVTLARGAVRMSKARVIVKHLSAIQNLGSVDVLCSDKTGTLTTGVLSLEESIAWDGSTSERARGLGAVNSALETGIRSPLDEAILRATTGKADGWEKRDEVPFDFERRRVSIVAEYAGDRWLIVKGAPEPILSRVVAVDEGGKDRPIDDAVRASVAAQLEAMGESGFRVLAVAAKRIPEKIACTVDDECDLVLIGLLAFSDPPRPDAKETLAALTRDGVVVKILTGDGEAVARHVCSAVGLDVSRVVMGDEIERMTDSALAHVVERAQVFARVSPAQKSRILVALKSRSHVVGFLGDGINDAPSLHIADVGVSVAGAVDVAREAADVILLGKGLDVLHGGIAEGRRALVNVMKYLLMGTSSNFGNVFSMAGAALFLPFLPMSPLQILLNNLLYDVAQITIPTDAVDVDAVRSPERWNTKTIRDFMLFLGPISSLYDFATFFVLLHYFHASERFFHTGWFVESLTTQTLVVFVIRTMGSPFKSRPSGALVSSVVAIVALGIALPFSPIGHALGFEPLPLGYFGFLALATATYLVVVDVVKRAVHRRLHATPSPTLA